MPVSTFETLFCRIVTLFALVSGPSMLHRPVAAPITIPAIGQAVQARLIHEIVPHLREPGGFDVDSTGRVEYGVVSSDEPGCPALLAHIVVAQVNADCDVPRAPGIDQVVLDRDVVGVASRIDPVDPVSTAGVVRMHGDLIPAHEDIR